MTGNRKYNIALIGAGRMGTRWAKVLAGSPQVFLSLVVDTDIRQAKRVAETHGTSYSASVKDALEQRIDAVCIATPHAYLFPLAKKALRAGKHVFVEKPGSRSAKEMQTLLTLSRRAKRALMVGFNYRYFDSLQKAKAIIERGGIGTVTAIRIVHGHPGRRCYEKEWRMSKGLAGGGVLMDQGLHCIDLAQWFLTGRITKATGFVNNLAWKSEVEDAAALLLQTQRGQIASISVGISEWRPVFSLRLIGEKGYIVLDGLGRKYGDGAHLALGRYDRKKEELTEQIIACNPDADEALRREFSEFILGMERRPPSTNAEDALEVLKIIGTIYAKSS